MCGIAGIFNMNSAPVSISTLRNMTDAIAHRGPDGEGFYTDSFIGLGHRRLAIIDLTSAGHQPMSNEDGTVVISYNGEIYNFWKLRTELQALGHRFQSKTDTEVVVHAFEEWGEDAIPKFNGMFAFAIWDSNEQRLTLARDRFGIKPLYYGIFGKFLIFGSEIKALLEHPEVDRRLNYRALSDYVTFQNVFSDETLFQDIKLLPPATILNADLGNTRTIRQHTYWDYDFSEGPEEKSEIQWQEEIYHGFEKAVQNQLISDVPVGSYLSGGMDSGSITAVASKQIPRISTFTCGFDLSSASGLETQFDEREKAEYMSSLFKTEHYEFVLKAGDMEAVMPDLIRSLEDPRVGQCYPNYYVTRLASKFCKVVLSGAGGDEIFGGYPWRYYRTLNCKNREDYLRKYYDYWQRLIPDLIKPKCFTPDVWSKMKEHHPFESFTQVFKNLPFDSNGYEEHVNRSLYFESKTFLHGLLLVEDKLSMAHSLETRVPFLDNDLVDTAMRVPVRYKLSNIKEEAEALKRVDEHQAGKRQLYSRRHKDGKLILRKAMAPLIPKDIANLEKQGFSAPDASWFRGESIDYIRTLLLDKRANINSIFAPMFTELILEEHCSGKNNHRLLIWALLSLEWWIKTFNVKL
jgi:asparagine synthase (glutamine-hydrolysing)